MKVKNRYGILNWMKLTCYLIRTKLISHKARLIRFPIDLRGRKYIDFGEKLTTGVGCRLEAFSYKGDITMHFGKNVQLNDYVHITSMNNVTIGDNVLMASKIYISDCVHGIYNGDINDSSPTISPIDRQYLVKETIIEKNVWIGESVCVLPGVIIGEGAIIGAMSLVNKDIPPYTIAVGIPARVVKKYNFKTKKWERV